MEAKSRMSVLFIGKKDDLYCTKAQDFIAANFPEATAVSGRRGEPPPPEFDLWRGEYIFSYLSPWIVPARLLERARLAAINFHPGPPEYPGIGCTNFAIYNEETVFGVTCHHMAPLVDTGAIIAVRRFPLRPTDTVYSLTQRCYAHIWELFHEIVALILTGQGLPRSKEDWRREPYRRRQLDELCRLTPEMPPQEIRRRIRATFFPGMPGPYVELGGRRFTLAPEEPKDSDSKEKDSYQGLKA